MDYKQKYLKYKHKYLNLQNHTKHIKHIKGGIIPIPDKTKLIDCYIASSHNTYLNGHQITGKTDVNCYYNFIKYFKGGCVEMDVVKIIERDIDTRKKTDVKITHTATLTSSLWLSDILTKIRDILSDKKISLEGPIILSFDNKDILNDDDQHKVIKIINDYLGDYLYENYDDENLYFKDVKGKVLIKWPERKTDEKCECTTFCLAKGVLSKAMSKVASKVALKDTSKDTSKVASKVTSKDTSKDTSTVTSPDCKNLVRPLPLPSEVEGKQFKSKHWTNMHQDNTISYEHGKKTDEFDKSKFIRIYPPGRNTDSENYPFLNYVLKGANLIALNIQNMDIHTLYQLEFFRNGCLRKIPESVKSGGPQKIKYKIKFSEDLKNIKIKINDADSDDDFITKINADDEDIYEIELYEDFPLIYIECIIRIKINNEPKDENYKGVITLTEKDNKIYKKKKLHNSCGMVDNKCNCTWYNEILKNTQKLTCEKIEKDIINITLNNDSS